jgi:chromate transporter
MNLTKRLFEILLVATKLGVTSFGGPIAHLGYFRNEYVKKRGWLSEEQYTSIISLCQILPGPTSSQVGIMIGMYRAGISGGIVAWVGFTLPSTIALLVFAMGVNNMEGLQDSGWLHGLKVLAVAIVAIAVSGMAKTICTNKLTTTIAVLSATAILILSVPMIQVLVISSGAFIGYLYLKPEIQSSSNTNAFSINKKIATFSILLFFSVLIALPYLSNTTSNPFIEVSDKFYRTGSLVFGGGHVVLPLLQSEVVDSGLVAQDSFIAGYGAAQAIPGPLFTFAAYLGTVMPSFSNPLLIGLLCLIMIFIPSFLLIIGIVPFWDTLRSKSWFRGPLVGINASVVGLLIAALYDPIWISAVEKNTDVAVVIGLICIISIWKCPVWVAVLIAASLGEILSRNLLPL